LAGKNRTNLSRARNDAGDITAMNLKSPGFSALSEFLVATAPRAFGKKLLCVCLLNNSRSRETEEPMR
jgi:hypothetical protein